MAYIRTDSTLTRAKLLSWLLTMLVGLQLCVIAQAINCLFV